MYKKQNRPRWQGGPPDWVLWLMTILHGITVALHLVVIYIQWIK